MCLEHLSSESSTAFEEIVLGGGSTFGAFSNQIIINFNHSGGFINNIGGSFLPHMV